MIAAVATLKVHADKTKEFEDLFLGLAAKVKANEAGCIAYELTRSRTDANTYKILEIYKDQAAVDAHSGSSYFAETGPKIGPCLDGGASLEWLDGVD